MSSPGETLSTMAEASRPPQRFFALFALGLLLMGLGMGAYDATQDVNGILCTGCLGLNPKPADFNGFWVEYPSRHKDTGKEVNHFSWMEDDLKDELRISPELAEKMEDRLIAWFRPRNFVGYFWSRDTAGDAHRGWAALFLAEMTGEDD